MFTRKFKKEFCYEEFNEVEFELERKYQEEEFKDNCFIYLLCEIAFILCALAVIGGIIAFALLVELEAFLCFLFAPILIALFYCLFEFIVEWTFEKRNAKKLNKQKELYEIITNQNIEKYEKAKEENPLKWRCKAVLRNKDFNALEDIVKEIINY